MTTAYLIAIALYSTAIYLYLHKKTMISLQYLYKDNIVVILLSAAILLFGVLHLSHHPIFCILSIVAIIPIVILFICLLRFYRAPLRKVNMEEHGIVSPADGHVIYIKQIASGEMPISVKNGVKATLNEFANTGLLDCPCWLVGINMTPLDVHKNCAPIDGTILLNKHFDGEFLSLKHEEALRRNERNTIVIDHPNGKVGVVQTASRRVRRIVTYKKEGEMITKGDWFGMIKFGSQVDLIIPATCKLSVELGQQVYARKTMMAWWT